MGGICGGISSCDYLEDNRLSNEIVKRLVEYGLTQSATEVREGTIGGCFHEVEPTEEAEPGIMLKRRGKTAIRTNFIEIDQELCLEQGNRIVAVRSFR